MENTKVISLMVHELTRANFRNVTVLTHVCQILVKVLNSITVRFISFLSQSMDIKLLSLLNVSSLSWCEMIVIMRSLPLPTWFVSIIDIFIGINRYFGASTYIKYQLKSCCLETITIALNLIMGTLRQVEPNKLTVYNKIEAGRVK